MVVLLWCVLGICISISIYACFDFECIDIYIYVYTHEYICVYMQIYCMTKPTLVDDQNYILIDAYR